MGFMDFLDDVDDKIINETLVDTQEYDDIEDEVVTPMNKVKKSNNQKSVSVKQIEYRIREKLEEIGFNDRVVDDFIRSVLGDIAEVLPSVAPRQEPVHQYNEGYYINPPINNTYIPTHQQHIDIEKPMPKSTPTEIADYASVLLD